VQSALIVGQTAMVVVLLAAAGLLIRSYINVVNVDTGFSQSTVTFHLTFDDRYKPQEMSAFYRDLMAKLEALPGVQARYRRCAPSSHSHRSLPPLPEQKSRDDAST
jgi:hypothetical protein